MKKYFSVIILSLLVSQVNHTGDFEQPNSPKKYQQRFSPYDQKRHVKKTPTKKPPASDIENVNGMSTQNALLALGADKKLKSSKRLNFDQ